MISAFQAETIAFVGEHVKHGDGVYCVDCWACSTDQEEDHAAHSRYDMEVYANGEEVTCDACGAEIVEPDERPDPDPDDEDEEPEYPEDEEERGEDAITAYKRHRECEEGR